MTNQPVPSQQSSQAESMATTSDREETPHVSMSNSLAIETDKIRIE